MPSIMEFVAQIFDLNIKEVSLYIEKNAKLRDNTHTKTP